jgi:hypothetical protein
MKFLNKKEQVLDIQLTPYGKQKLSMGELKPTYYAFFDDNIAYDRRYFTSASLELQNDIHKRIKEETQYLETQAIFKQVLSGTLVAGGIISDVTLTQPDNIYTTDSFIGDALLQSEQSNVAPAWKVVAMQSTISSSVPVFTGSLITSREAETERNRGIVQINLNANYDLKAQVFQPSVAIDDIRDTERTSDLFADNTVAKLEYDDPLIYVEELNTELLTDNFLIEVFEVPEDNEGSLRRLNFRDRIPQVVNGLLVHSTPQTSNQELDTDSVEYYFSIDKDYQIEPSIACKYVNQFNTEDYLIDLDFDCEDTEDEDVFFDIYGRVTESEICPD